MNSSYPDGIWLKIQKENQDPLEIKLLLGNILEFSDCIPIATESRKYALDQNKGDISLEKIEDDSIEIQDLHTKKTFSLSLQQSASLTSKDKEHIELTLLGIRKNANQENWNTWRTS